ncbi:MAG TPA: TonB-dependent receptor, partial [Sphingomicrobium sp.]
GKWDPQASGLISWKNAGGTLGVLLGAVYQKREIRRDGVEVLTYFNNPAVAGGAQIPGLIGSALFKQDRERYGANIGVQVRPSDQFEVNVTGLYTRFNANNFNQNFMAWGSNAIGGGGTLTNFTVEDDTVTKGTITSTPGGRGVVFDAIDRLAFSEVWSGDFDTIWRPSDLATVHFKAGYTEAHGNTKAQPFFEGGAPAAFDFDLTGRTPQVTFHAPFDPTDPNDMAFDFGSLHKITNSDKEKYAYLDYEQKLGLGPINALKVGAKVTDHDRKTGFLATTYGGFFLPLSATGCGGGPCTPSDFADGLTPGDFLDNIALPGTLTQYWQVDQHKLEDIFLAFPHARVLNPTENYSINEKTYGGYAMVKFGGDNWRGNIGLRVVRTDQTSRGNQLFASNPPPNAISNPFGAYLPITVKKHYTDFLPSANVSFDLDPTLVLRFAAARTMARPDYTDIVPRVSLNPGALTGSGGDPSVKPFRADQYDVSLEWYPDRETIVAAALYYKDIQSYIVNTTTQEVFPIQTDTPNLSLCTLVTAPNTYNCQFAINRRSNGAGGSNKGFEIQVSRPIWGGFGIIGNYTYSDAKSNSGDPIPGNSKHAFNVTGYYERGPVSARLSYTYRSKFFIDIDRAAPLNQKATGSLDASASYKLTDNFWLTADAINLTNEKIEQFSGTTTRPRAIYDNGRQFYIGARFRY